VFDALFASDVRAPYLLVGALAPEMAERGNGSIINISSMGAKVDLPGAAAYSPTKGAIEALTRSWAAEFGSRRVRVNAVAPGPVYTSAPAERTSALGATTILGRAAQPGEITRPYSNLVSRTGSPHLSGDVPGLPGTTWFRRPRPPALALWWMFAVVGRRRTSTITLVMRPVRRGRRRWR
jgi:NAD(P)-dependent dehydrogenase (short-subunit alcohol dehydrogenase family)